MWNTLERVFQKTTADWERVRRGLPPILANVAPPAPTDVKEFTLYQGGLLWGAVQGLFGMLPVVGMIPDVVQFLQFFSQKVGESGFWTTIWEYLKAQWQQFASLFTQDQGQGSFERGQLLGNVLIGVIVAVIGVLLALLSDGVTLEFTAVGILRLLKQAGKIGVETAKTALKENVAAARSIGRSVRHGFPHAVEGTADLLRGRKPFDWESQLNRVHRSVSGHILGKVEEVRGAIQVGQELHSRVSQHLKGKQRFTEDEVGRYIRNQSGSPSSGGAGGSGELSIADINALAKALKVKDYEYAARIEVAEDYARRLGVGTVDYGGEQNLQAANVTNLALQRINDLNAARTPENQIPLPGRIELNERDKGLLNNPGAIGHTVQNTIVFNPQHPYFQDPAAGALSEFSTGYWSTFDPSHPVFHEIGHVAHFNAILSTIPGGKENEAFRLSVDQLMTTMQQQGEKGLGAGKLPLTVADAQEISNRAAVDKLELVAEVFANRVSQASSANKYLRKKGINRDTTNIPARISNWLRLNNYPPSNIGLLPLKER